MEATSTRCYARLGRRSSSGASPSRPVAQYALEAVIACNRGGAQTAVAKAAKAAKTAAKAVEAEALPVEALPAIKEELPARRPLGPLKVNTTSRMKKLYDSKSYRATL
eukprot:scaffold69595_cov72-Phaeocystis_antarctica.AAC.2